MGDVRARALDVLETVDVEAGAEDPRFRDGFVYEMLIAHEHQHNETMLQLLQMVAGYEPPARRPLPGASAAAGPEMVAIRGGVHEVGAAPAGFAYDNERRRHEVELAPFRIDRVPVTNADFARFLAESGGEPPMYWEPDGGGGWVSTVFGGTDPVQPDRPVVHVDARQADEFARWAGRRLPTEAEWEAAAAGVDPAHANLDQLGFGCAPAGSYEQGASEAGAVQMLGDVWEWTASEFGGYPGFEPFPYPEYSQEFFGEGYRVLRGGSWATSRNVIRPSFRNWDLPVRRQIFAGFRCAEDG